MMFAPSRKRSAYFPRTPPRKSYSGRRSSLESAGLLVFFIGLAFTARGRSGTDDTNLINTFCVCNYQEAARNALTDKEPSLLTDRMLWIGDRDRQRIADG